MILSMLAAKFRITLAVAGAATLGAVAGAPVIMSMTASAADVPVQAGSSQSPSTSTSPTSRPASNPGEASQGPANPTSVSGGEETQKPVTGASEQPAAPSSDPSAGEIFPATPPAQLPPCPIDIRNHGAYVSSVPAELRSAAAHSACGKGAGADKKAKADHGSEQTKPATPGHAGKPKSSEPHAARPGKPPTASAGSLSTKGAGHGKD